MSAHREIVKKLRKSTLLEDLIQNIKFCACIHQIGCLRVIQARYNPDKSMDANVADLMVGMSSNTRRRWLCQYCGAYCRKFIQRKKKHHLKLTRLRNVLDHTPYGYRNNEYNLKK